MKLNKIMLIILILAIIPLSACTDVRQNYDCTPPFNFSKEYNCSLTPRVTSSINEFTCYSDSQNRYRLIGDCQGGVIDVHNLSNTHIPEVPVNELSLGDRIMGTLFYYSPSVLIFVMMFWIFIEKYKELRSRK